MDWAGVDCLVQGLSTASSCVLCKSSQTARPVPLFCPTGMLGALLMPIRIKPACFSTVFMRVSVWPWSCRLAHQWQQPLIRGACPGTGRVEPFCLAEAPLKQELMEVLPVHWQRAGAGRCTCKTLDHAVVSSLVLPPGCCQVPWSSQSLWEIPLTLATSILQWQYLISPEQKAVLSQACLEPWKKIPIGPQPFLGLIYYLYAKICFCPDHANTNHATHQGYSCNNCSTYSQSRDKVLTMWDATQYHAWFG